MSALAEYRQNEHSSMSMIALDATEDGDSRDSGISITSCSSDDTDLTIITNQCGKDNKTMVIRHPLVDCTNFVSKSIFSSSSSRNSSLYQNDTPTGRKKKSVFSSESDKDQSLYEQYYNQISVLKSRSVSLGFDELPSSISRKRTSSSSSTTTLTTTVVNRKRSKQMMVADLCDNSPFDEEEVFSSIAIPEGPSHHFHHSQSLWNIDEMHHRNSGSRRIVSNDSLNGSVNVHCTGPSKAHRAMSVGFIEPDGGLPPCLEVKYNLPAVENPQKESQAYRSVSPMTLFEEFQRLGDYFHSVYIVVDCRYPFEYNGGHIKGAINIYKKSDIESIFFSEKNENQRKLVKKRIPIFYCEFSQKRGPTMANTLRSIDRVRNELNYPHVEYPEIYLLDHGYRSLWRIEKCREICDPRNYVPMDKPEFSNELKSFRGARLRSNASMKSNSDLSLTTSRKLSVRKSSTVLRIKSNLSLAGSLATSCSELNDDDVFFGLDSSVKMRKSISACEIASVESKINIDGFIPFTHIDDESTSEPVDKDVQLENVRNEEVKTALKFKTPDIPIPLAMQMQAEKEEGLTPRAKLDFSSISDTE